MGEAPSETQPKDPMFALLATILLSVSAPADGLRLGDQAPAEGRDRGVVTVPSMPPQAPLPPSWQAGAAGSALGLAVLAAGWRVLGDDEEIGDLPDVAVGGAPPIPADAYLVVVPGHGTPGPQVFDDLIGQLGVDPDHVIGFDFAWFGDDHVAASQHVPTEFAAGALNGALTGLAETGHPIYVIGFSKGAATAAEMVANWDETGHGVVDQVEAVFLLDAPLSAGAQGVVQSVGQLIGPLPDDGGFNPIRCKDTRCWDVRSGLGDASGVHVVAIRNPHSSVANFTDAPPGFLSYDAPFGLSQFEILTSAPWTYPDQVSKNHNSVLHNPAVAACIAQEIAEPESCTALEQTGWKPNPGVITHGLGGQGGVAGPPLAV